MKERYCRACGNVFGSDERKPCPKCGSSRTTPFHRLPETEPKDGAIAKVIGKTDNGQLVYQRL